MTDDNNKGTMMLKLKETEIAMGSKQIFSIPNKSKIRLIDIKEALLAKNHTLTDVEHCLREIDPLATYTWSAINIFANNNELTIYADPRDEVKLNRFLELFKRSFKCKTPFGGIQKFRTDDGRELIKIVMVKDLF